jgi:ribosome-binding factor A
MGLRQQRLADEIRDVLAACFTSGQMSDPRLANVSITAVKLSGDLQVASVYFRIYGHEAQLPGVQKGLESAAGFLRRRLAETFDIRRVPALRFFYDESIERGSRIEELLAQLGRS